MLMFIFIFIFIYFYLQGLSCCWWTQWRQLRIAHHCKSPKTHPWRTLTCQWVIRIKWIYAEGIEDEETMKMSSLQIISKTSKLNETWRENKKIRIKIWRRHKRGISANSMLGAQLRLHSAVNLKTQSSNWHQNTGPQGDNNRFFFLKLKNYK